MRSTCAHAASEAWARPGLGCAIGESESLEANGIVHGSLAFRNLAFKTNGINRPHGDESR